MRRIMPSEDNPAMVVTEEPVFRDEYGRLPGKISKMCGGTARILK